MRPTPVGTRKTVSTRQRPQKFEQPSDHWSVLQITLRGELHHPKRRRARSLLLVVPVPDSLSVFKRKNPSQLIDHIAIAVAHLDATRDLYENGLGFIAVRQTGVAPERTLVLENGRDEVVLMECHGDLRDGQLVHMAFRLEAAEFGETVAQLQAQGVELAWLTCGGAAIAARFQVPGCPTTLLFCDSAD